MIEGWKICSSELYWAIGNGKNINLWEDKQMPNNKILRELGPPK